jgi:hypothetical protein
LVTSDGVQPFFWLMSQSHRQLPSVTPMAAGMLPLLAAAAFAALAAGTAAAAPAPPPLPPRQTPVQRDVIERVQRAAPADSAAATADVLRFMDDPAFRAHLRGCCPSVAQLSAPALYSRFRAEVATMELVHNWDPRDNGSPMDELNLTTWLEAKYDYNLWQMSVLGLRHASFLFNCDLAEVGLFGFPPFKGVSRRHSSTADSEAQTRTAAAVSAAKQAGLAEPRDVSDRSAFLTMPYV